MLAMAGGRIGRQPALDEIGIAADIAAVRRAAAIGADPAFLQSPGIGGEVPDDGVNQRLRRRCVGILDDQGERPRAGGHAAPHQRGRHAVAVGGESRRQARPVGESRAGEVERLERAAELGLEDAQFVGAGAKVAQGVAEPAGDVFEHLASSFGVEPAWLSKAPSGRCTPPADPP
jgi:hypothetical protein